MKHLILATLILLSLKSWADGGNGVERMELPAEVRVRIAQFLVSNCGLQLDSAASPSVAEFIETADSYEVAVELPANGSGERAVVRMTIAKGNVSSTDLQVHLMDSNYQNICK